MHKLAEEIIIAIIIMANLLCKNIIFPHGKWKDKISQNVREIVHWAWHGTKSIVNWESTHPMHNEISINHK